MRQRKRDEAEDEDGEKEEERRQNEVRDALPARGRRGEDAQCWSDGGSGAVAPVGPVPAAAAGTPPGRVAQWLQRTSSGWTALKR